MNYQEHYTQKSCMNWLRANYPWIGNLAYAVPNGQHRTKAQSAVLKSEGMMRGVADICIDIPGGMFHALRIEMKTSKGKQSSHQSEFQSRCNAVGIMYAIVRSRDEFEDLVSAYMDTVPQSYIDNLKQLDDILLLNEQELEKAKTARELKRLSKSGKPSSATEHARQELKSFLAKHVN